MKKFLAKERLLGVGMALALVTSPSLLAQSAGKKTVYVPGKGLVIVDAPVAGPETAPGPVGDTPDYRSRVPAPGTPGPVAGQPPAYGPEAAAAAGVSVNGSGVGGSVTLSGPGAFPRPMGERMVTPPSREKRSGKFNAHTSGFGVGVFHSAGDQGEDDSISKQVTGPTLHLGVSDFSMDPVNGKAEDGGIEHRGSDISELKGQLDLNLAWPHREYYVEGKGKLRALWGQTTVGDDGKKLGAHFLGGVVMDGNVGTEDGAVNPRHGFLGAEMEGGAIWRVAPNLAATAGGFIDLGLIGGQLGGRIRVLHEGDGSGKVKATGEISGGVGKLGLPDTHESYEFLNVDAKVHPAGPVYVYGGLDVKSTRWSGGIKAGLEDPKSTSYTINGGVGLAIE